MLYIFVAIDWVGSCMATLRAPKAFPYSTRAFSLLPYGHTALKEATKADIAASRTWLVPRRRRTSIMKSPPMVGQFHLISPWHSRWKKAEAIRVVSLLGHLLGLGQTRAVWEFGWEGVMNFQRLTPFPTHGMPRCVHLEQEGLVRSHWGGLLAVTSGILGTLPESLEEQAASPFSSACGSHRRRRWMGRRA